MVVKLTLRSGPQISVPQRQRRGNQLHEDEARKVSCLWANSARQGVAWQAGVHTTVNRRHHKLSESLSVLSAHFSVYIQFIYKSSHAFSSAYHCFCGPPLWPIPSLMSASESTNQSRWSVLHGTVESIILLCSSFAPSYLENLVTVRPRCCYDKCTEFHFSTVMEITRDANCEQTERVWILISNSRFNKHPAAIWCGCYKYKYTGSIVFLLFMSEDSFNNAL